jgi:hypothetical protein
MSDGRVSPDPPERAMGRRWLAVAAAALVTGAYAAQVVVSAAETSPAPIAGIAPSYGPKTVSAVPNAAAIVRRIWLPGLDAGYDPQGLAVDGGGIYVSAYSLLRGTEGSNLPPSSGESLANPVRAASNCRASSQYVVQCPGAPSSPSTGDRGFESGFLQRRVSCEPGGLLEGRARNRIRSANTRCSFWSEIQLLAESGRAGQRPRS